MEVRHLYAASSKKSSAASPTGHAFRVSSAAPFNDRRKLRAYAGSILAPSIDVSFLRSTYVDRVLADGERLEYGGLLEVVSFITLVALIVISGLSVAAVTLLYATGN